MSAATSKPGAKMPTFPVGLHLVGAAVSVEIIDGHGTWSLGRQSTFSQEITAQSGTGFVTIDEKTALAGPKISLQSDDNTINISTVLLIHVQTSHHTLTVKATNSIGTLTKVKGPNNEFVDNGTGTWTHVLTLS
jgi:hypothetical protein